MCRSSKDLLNASRIKFNSLVDNGGLLLDDLIGQDEDLSVFVLSYCTRELINDKLYWKLYKKQN